MGLSWAYGVTTVPSRRKSHLPETLASLRNAGFPSPRLFVDGGPGPGIPWEEEFGLEVTVRGGSPVKTSGNWLLSLAELYARNPWSSRYALFQDDFTTYRNLRGYLEAIPYPPCAYLNLYTFPINEALAPKIEGKKKVGWYPSNQLGKGAVALVFSIEAVLDLLGSRDIIERPRDKHRGWKAIDGGIVTALKKKGYTEYVHYPSLVQHTGLVSSMGNRPHKLAPSFRGSDYDAMKLIDEK